jgi:hypothetical protein
MEQRSTGSKVWVASGRPQAKRRMHTEKGTVGNSGLEKRVRKEKAKLN